jgi:hypothetical protein
LVLVKNTQVENVDFTRNGNLITFTTAPTENSTIIVKYVTNRLLNADFAVSVPFNKIDGMTTRYVDNVLGGLDFSITSYHGKRIVFARQEQYPGYIEDNDGWIQNNSIWDNDIWDNPEIGWDDYRIVPGYNENQANPNIDNERAGIWEINVTENGTIRLVFVRPVDLGQRVQIKYGFVYTNKIIRFGPLIKFNVGETVPSYSIVGETLQRIETTFDGGSTRFVESINVYQSPDEGDKYLVFPRVNIFA